MLGLSQTPASDLAIPQRGYLALNETTDKASMLGREHEARRRNYGVATSWALAFSLAALLWGLWQLPSSILEFEECRRLDERAQALHSKLLLYDEVLTMSARLCASTGDPTWDQRYRQHEGLLDAAIKEAMALLPGAGLAASTNQANEALVFKEHRALELASRGKLTFEIAQKLMGLVAKGPGVAADWTHFYTVGKDKTVVDILLGAGGPSRFPVEHAFTDNTKAKILRPQYTSPETREATLNWVESQFGKVDYDTKFSLKSDDR